MSQNTTNIIITDDTNDNPINISVPKSQPKPIAKKQLHLLKFGTYFSKSPKLTNNRVTTNKNKDDHKAKEQNNYQLSVAMKTRQISAESTSTSQSAITTNTAQRLSQSDTTSTPNSHSRESNSLEIDNHPSKDNPIFFPNDSNSRLDRPANNGPNQPFSRFANPRPSINTRYTQLMKEYVFDNDSTLSSSTDIQDDLSSVASDGIDIYTQNLGHSTLFRCE